MTDVCRDQGVVAKIGAWSGVCSNDEIKFLPPFLDLFVALLFRARRAIVSASLVVIMGSLKTAFEPSPRKQAVSVIEDIHYAASGFLSLPCREVHC